MVTRASIAELHAGMHECLDLILELAAGVPHDLLAKELPGFGHATVLKQITHVLETEAGWIRRLQSLTFEPLEVGLTVDELRQAKQRVMAATRAYLNSTSEADLNAELTEEPQEWVGPLRAPVFILMHIVTHSFHHKGQMVAMLRLLGYPAPDTDLQRE